MKFIMNDKTVRSVITIGSYGFLLNCQGIIYVKNNEVPIFMYENESIYKICCTNRFILILYDDGTTGCLNYKYYLKK
jgi:hypothetical protein